MTAGVRLAPEVASGQRLGAVARYVPAAILAVMVVAAVLAPVLPLQPPNAQHLGQALKPPVGMGGGSAAHPLGTDGLGRDILARLVFGARLTLFIAGVGVAVSGAFGTILGLVAGYLGRSADFIIGRLTDAQLALPYILLAVAIIASNGPSKTALILVLAIIGWAKYTRVVRSEVLSLRERLFVRALRSQGLSQPRVLLSHVLRNLVPTVATLATLHIGELVLFEAALSFLGLGIVPPDISWGRMLADGRAYLQQAWWPIALPGISITLLVVCINLTVDQVLER